MIYSAAPLKRKSESAHVDDEELRSIRRQTLAALYQVEHPSFY